MLAISLFFALLIRGISTTCDRCTPYIPKTFSEICQGSPPITQPFCLQKDNSFVSAGYAPRLYGEHYGVPVWNDSRFDIKAFQLHYKPFATYNTYFLGSKVTYVNESHFYPGLSSKTYTYSLYIQKMKNFVKVHKYNLTGVNRNQMDIDELVGLAAWILTNQGVDYYNYDLYNHVNQRNRDNPWRNMPDTLYGIIETLKIDIEARARRSPPLKYSHSSLMDYGTDEYSEPYLWLQGKSLVYVGATVNHADTSKVNDSIEVVLKKKLYQYCLVFLDADFPVISNEGVLLRDANPGLFCWFEHRDRAISNPGILKAKCAFKKVEGELNANYTKILKGGNGPMAVHVEMEKTCYIITNTKRLRIFDVAYVLGYDGNLTSILKSVHDSPYFK